MNDSAEHIRTSISHELEVEAALLRYPSPFSVKKAHTGKLAARLDVLARRAALLEGAPRDGCSFCGCGPTERFVVQHSPSLGICERCVWLANDAVAEHGGRDLSFWRAVSDGFAQAWSDAYAACRFALGIGRIRDSRSYRRGLREGREYVERRAKGEVDERR